MWYIADLEGGVHGLCVTLNWIVCYFQEGGVQGWCDPFKWVVWYCEEGGVGL